MRATRFVALAAVLAASGCFAYVPSSPQELVPGEAVRLRLSAQEAMRYADLRLADPRSLEGTFLERSGEELMVEATVAASDRERGSQFLVQRVTVSLTGILDVEKKKLNTLRTSLVVGGGAVAVAAFIVGNATGWGSESEQNPDNPEARKIPLLRFSLPLGGR